MPQSLVSRVYALYSVTLLLFVGTGLWLFYHYQFVQTMEDAQQSATMLIEVVAQTISDSAVIGDYDTIKRTLDKSILRSQFNSAAYIDLNGGVIRLENTVPPAIHSPAWLHDSVADYLYDVNRNISVGGHDYGVLRLSFAVDVIASGLWQLMQAALGLAVVGFFGGLLLIWFPLRHWLGSLERVHTFEADFSSDGELAGLALLHDVPLEFRPTFEVLNRTAITLRDELETRAQAVASLRSALGSLLPNAESVAGDSDDIAVLSQMILELMRERQARQKELELAMAAADAANKAKSEFLANMSHEIRTPMNGILGMTNLVLGSTLTDEQRDLISIVKGSADTLLVIINDILDFSKIEAGKLTIEEVPFDLRQAVNEAMHTLAESAREKGLLLGCAIDAAVPQIVVGDSVRLRQVLLNLIGNAIKFTPHGEVAVRCVLGVSQGNKVTLHFTVQDSGVGIAPEMIPHIFSAFTQEDSSTTRRFGGTGLGLTISRRFVELMLGRMWVESELGRGSSFHFTIGVGEAPAVLAMATEKPSAGARPEVINPGWSVLLVEDHPVNQKLAKMLLERRGYRVTLAENGREAVNTFTQEKFAMVLMDMHMPEMDGVEATVVIRALEKNEQRSRTPIVAMTANAMPADRERCLAAGMDDYLSKPINAAELFAIIERLLNG